jgi:hypothetical protein
MFSDLVFRPLLKLDKTLAMLTLIRHYKSLNALIGLFIDNHIGLGKDFKVVFNFLHKLYFPQVAFGLVCLSKDKLNLFCSKLDTIGFLALDS